MADTPQPASPNTNPKPAEKPVNKVWKKIKRFFYLLVFVIIVILGVFIYWKYFFTYSEGYRAGLLQKFSRKGNIFKTYEGEMILSSVRGTNNVAIASEKFNFSVVDSKITGQLDSLQGQNVVVHYHEKNGTLPWRGDNRYIVDEVKPGN